MYFDAVLDENMRPVFNGTPTEVLNWLNENAYAQQRSDWRVCRGKDLKLINTWEYVHMYS